MDKRYQSDIPKNAKERITKRYPSGEKQSSEYFLRGKHVGHRSWDDANGPFGGDEFIPPELRLHYEMPLRNGIPHGRHYYLERGIVTFVEPYHNGRIHGTARQYDNDRSLMGTYRMVNGTGVDLWRNRHYDGSGEFFLAEVSPRRDGAPHGMGWWINDDQRTVYIEWNFCDGQLHGIHREWNGSKLRRGYPKYFVHGKPMTKRQYIRACKGDQTLPPFREKDNKPQRTFPLAIAKHLNPPKRRRKQ